MTHLKRMPAPTEQCEAILERAVKIWKNPRKRVRRIWKTDNGAFCVLGALNQARADISDTTWDQCLAEDQDAMAHLIGYPNASTVIDINDNGAGPDYLYERMQEALRRAKGELHDRQD